MRNKPPQGALVTPPVALILLRQGNTTILPFVMTNDVHSFFATGPEFQALCHQGDGSVRLTNALQKSLGPGDISMCLLRQLTELCTSIGHALSLLTHMAPHAFHIPASTTSRAGCRPRGILQQILCFFTRRSMLELASLISAASNEVKLFTETPVPIDSVPARQLSFVWRRQGRV